MLTPDTVGLSAEDLRAYSDVRRFLEYQRKVLVELRPVWPIPPRVLTEAYHQMRNDSASATRAGARPAESVWAQQDFVALVASAWEEFPSYLRVVPMRDVTPAALLKKNPADNPALRAYFKLLSLVPDQAVLVFPVSHHGNWVVHNLGEPPFPQPMIRAVLPAVAKDRRNIVILPIKTFAKEWSDGREKEE